MQFLFPSSAFNPAQVDEHFAAQADAVDSYALVDMDALTSGFGRVFRRLNSDRVVYRGWMLTPKEYSALSDALVGQDVQMLTSDGQYASAHNLPGWYHKFQDVTPASAILSASPTVDEITKAAADLGSTSFIVKDYVKSRKHEWDTACYAKDIDSLPGVVAEFVRLQEDSIAGGVVIRAFEELTGAEARVWWVDGYPIVITAHPDTPDNCPTPSLEHVYGPVADLACPFVTTDLALRSDGSWRVVEVGDGQVSDFPATGDFATLAAALSKQ